MKNLLLSTLSLFLACSLYAQIDVKNTRQGESVEYCIQHKKLNELKLNPAFLQQFILDQQELQAVEQQLNNQTSPKRVVYTIPIVFHILHNGGVENITNAQIQDAVDVLNRDYRLLNADANTVVFDFNASNPNAVCQPADVELQFVLATKAPNGACFSGVTRTQSSQSYSGDGQAQLTTIKNGNDVYKGEWAGDKYLNVFVCGDIGGAAGYTYNPSNWMGNAMANGIYILHDYVGRIGTGNVGTDRALTHEIGHWLNLDHTWGNTNDPGISCGDDQVADTPITKGVTACLLNEASCGPKANVENYMDYSYCSKMFTGGQKSRMIAALNSTVGGRNNLAKASNLTATGADGNTFLCKADFYANRVKICAGDSIQFFDNSFNNVISWSWTFQGGTIASSTLQNPTVTFNTPGVYNISLTVGDGNTTMTKILNQYITVTGAGKGLPFFEGFENYSNLASSAFWSVDNQQNNAAFEITTTAALKGIKSVKLANYGQTGTNVDELLSDPIDLSKVTSISGATLSFRYSYRKKVSTNSEKLYVYLSGNCAKTWEIRKSLQGTALSSISQNSSWTPTSAADWTTVHMTNITSQYWNQNFRFKFRFEGSGGNNLYLDNINLYVGAPQDSLVLFAAGLTENNVNSNFFEVFPNPADEEVNISYNVDADILTSVKIIDVLGKTLSENYINSITGNNLVVIPTDRLSNGIYIAQIEIAGRKYTKQFIIK